MTLGRTSSGSIKIKTDEAGGGLRAVNCTCCGGCDVRITTENVDLILTEPNSVNVNTPLYSGSINIENNTVLTNFGDETTEIYYITYVGEWKNTIYNQQCSECYYDYYDEQGNGIGTPIYCNDDDFREVGDIGVFEASYQFYRDLTGSTPSILIENTARIRLSTFFLTSTNCDSHQQNTVEYVIEGCSKGSTLSSNQFLDAIFNASGGQDLWTTA